MLGKLTTYGFALTQTSPLMFMAQAQEFSQMAMLLTTSAKTNIRSPHHKFWLAIFPLMKT
jgi:hypothetical protein